MCLFDMKVQQGTTFRKVQFPGLVGGVVALPSLRRALWMRVTVDGVDAVAYWNQEVQGVDQLPADKRLGGSGGTELYYSREHCGGAFTGTVFVNANNLQTVRVTWCEFDAAADVAINS